MNSWCWGQNITTPIRSHIRMDQYHQEGCRINITSLHSYQWNLHKPLSWIKDSLWHNLLTTVHTCRLGLSLWRETMKMIHLVLLIHYEVERWWKERSLSTRGYCLIFILTFAFYFIIQPHITPSAADYRKRYWNPAFINSSLTTASTV